MIASLAQFVRNRLTATPREGSLSQLRARILRRAERALKYFGDPLVKSRIGNYTLTLPLSHMLPELRRMLPHYSLNLGRIGRYVHSKYPSLAAIDIGANIGDSIALMRSEATYPILCVEGDARYFPLLQRNAATFADVDLEEAYVGDADQEVRGAIDHRLGTARIDASAAGMITTRSLATIVKRHPRFARAKLLKIDTDGFDAKIIRGSVDFLMVARPVVFFEYDREYLAAQNDDGVSVFETLRSADYRRLMIYSNLGPLLSEMRCDDSAGLKKLHDSIGRGKEIEYVDIAAFHGEDDALAGEAMAREREHFENSQ